jgi:hypothetical protein
VLERLLGLAGVEISTVGDAIGLQQMPHRGYHDVPFICRDLGADCCDELIQIGADDRASPSLSRKSWCHVY